ncbi:MAG: sn-glycerol-3-phosphate ABC transporter ATP-binding protein UgpC [Lachnospiraceae bacterium]|nr:sn-glycerol-3-phosphate ABC transporter ATP-binding protein UgpC [Lachnospiraceae bacterium]
MTETEIVLKNVCKVYDNGFEAVRDVNLQIRPKEFIIFVGPSGCGKSTTLRMIAGLEEISSGELWIGDVLANFLEPKERELSMVFQNYALYPNMSVYKNIAFSLEIRGVKKAEVDKRVKETAKLLGLEEVLDRRPKDLSGGQRQRVAIGNAIIRNPEILLMDEPLSNLDAKLRGQMRVELAKLHETLGNTIIYVTHDQTEAMTLGTRIVVMNEGVIQQVDTPERLYDNPVNQFVAGFIGSPAMNFIDCTIQRNAAVLQMGIERIGCNAKIAGWLEDIEKRSDLVVGIRPEAFLDEYRKEKMQRDDLGDDQKMIVTITHRELLGNEVLLYFDFCGKNCCMKASVDNYAKAGNMIPVWVDVNKIHLFDKETGKNLFYEKNFSIGKEKANR